LQKHLKDLAHYGYLEKQADGTYRTTEDGRRLLQVEASESDSIAGSKIDEALFEAINKKLKLSGPPVAPGNTNAYTPLHRLYNIFPSIAGPARVKPEKDQAVILRKLVIEMLSKLDVRVRGVDVDTMSEDHKVRILNNMLDSLGVMMSYYESRELLDRKYEVSITLDMTGIKDDDRELMVSALFWIFKYRSFDSMR
jgi:hypothetical protein